MTKLPPNRPRATPKASRRAAFVSRPPAPARAFSLIELTVVLAMITVLAAIAIPRFGGVVAGYRASAAARKIVADLTVARSQAMIASTSQPVAFSPSSDTYQLVGLTHPDHINLSWIVDLSAEPYRVDLISASFAGTATVTFDMYGSADNSGSIVVQAGGSQRTVLVDAQSGKASVQ